MSDKMQVDEMSLDQMVKERRRRDGQSGSGRPAGNKNRNNKPRHSSGTGTGSGADGPWKHDLFPYKKATSPVNPLAARIEKHSGPVGIKKANSTSNLPKIAKAAEKDLGSNPLFQALHKTGGSGAGGAGAGSKKDGVKRDLITGKPISAQTHGKPIGDIGAAIRGASGRNTHVTLKTKHGKDVGREISIKGTAGGFNIRGAAGPFVVHISNLATGTTSADLKKALKDNGLGPIKECNMIATEPVVIAEIVYQHKENADRCIELLDGMRADDKILSVFMHNGPPVGAPKKNEIGYENVYAVAREAADRSRMASNVSYTNGMYGFDAPKLYSDDIIRKGRGFQ